MSNPDIAAVATQIYALIKDLETEMRARVISAALTLVGDKETISSLLTIGKKNNEPDGDDSSGDKSNRPPKVKIWMKNNGLTQGHLDEVFHSDNNTTSIIAPDLPGKTASKKTIEAYVLVGIAAFLDSGETKFDDQSGRDACIKFGCFQEKHHSTTLKNRGSEMTGSKDAGWSLTGPGLKLGADLIKSIVTSQTS